ncbi:MAG: co-chaperone DjlA [Sphingobacteriales bacterium]|nr:MAG: co-chaperone DjlA [Sphingobacteriales bacterium]
MVSKEEFKKIRESFFNTIFVLLGHIANCDGYVNRDEIKRTQNYMEKMKLSPYCKQQAIRLFRKGSVPQFNIVDTLETFKESVAKSPRISEVLLVYIISVATVDGLLVDKEIKMVKKVASILGYSNLIFEHMLRMITAQEKIYGSAKDGKDQIKSEKANRRNLSAAETLDSAYHALGIATSSDEIEVKKAYRKLVNQYHPDKVQGQGLPPEFVNAATEYFKRIHTAYEYIIASK